MSIETQRIAKTICKQLQPLLGMTLTKRPRGSKGYTVLQGWRSAMTLCVGSCRRLGMSEDEVREAMERCLDGFREAEQDHEAMNDDNPLTAIKRVDFKPPPGWRRQQSPGLAALYIRNKLRLAASELLGVMTVSISRQQGGHPVHPTDVQCKETLEAFGLAGLEEYPMTSSARYFKPSTKGAS